MTDDVIVSVRYTGQKKMLDCIRLVQYWTDQMPDRPAFGIYMPSYSIYIKIYVHMDIHMICSVTMDMDMEHRQDMQHAART
jgi:hypothetical protein